MPTLGGAWGIYQQLWANMFSETPGLIELSDHFGNLDGYCESILSLKLTAMEHCVFCQSKYLSNVSFQALSGYIAREPASQTTKPLY